MLEKVSPLEQELSGLVASLEESNRLIAQYEEELRHCDEQVRSGSSCPYCRAAGVMLSAVLLPRARWCMVSCLRNGLLHAAMETNKKLVHGSCCALSSVCVQLSTLL